jgi:hypothetical protein
MTSLIGDSQEGAFGACVRVFVRQVQRQMKTMKMSRIRKKQMMNTLMLWRMTV